MICLTSPTTKFGSGYASVLVELNGLPMDGELAALFHAAKTARTDEHEGCEMQQALDAEEVAKTSAAGWRRDAANAIGSLLRASARYDARDSAQARTWLRQAWGHAEAAYGNFQHENMKA